MDEPWADASFAAQPTAEYLPDAQPPAGYGSEAQPPAIYRPPPAFAPPAFRVAPLNEAQVLGGTTYPDRQTYPDPLPDGDEFPSHARPSWHPSRLVRRDRGERRRRRVSIAVVAAVVVALSSIVAALITDGSQGSHPTRGLLVPDSVDEYTRISTLTSAQLHGLFATTGGTFGAIPAADLEAAQVGVYQANDLSSMVFIGFTAADSPSIGAQLRTEPADKVADGVLDSAAPSSPSIAADAGPLGGALRCARLVLAGQEAIAGVWADRDTLGIVVVVDTGATTTHTSAVTRDLRAEAEH